MQARARPPEPEPEPEVVSPEQMAEENAALKQENAALKAKLNELEAELRGATARRNVHERLWRSIRQRTDEAELLVEVHVCAKVLIAKK